METVEKQSRLADALPELGRSPLPEVVVDPAAMVVYWEGRLNDGLQAVQVAREQLEHWYRERVHAENRPADFI